ncbi:MAG: peptidylprolyl isomerase [Alphaproteobacteria bacterium]|nr:peptidylprolyl isomerase [Alphaproteobacteria bacterium]
MTKVKAGLATILMLGAMASAGFSAESPSAKTVLATVDGTKITLGNVIAFRGRLPAQYQKLPDNVLMPGIIEQLIKQTVLMNSVKGKLNTLAKVEFENQKRSFLASEKLSEISNQAITEQELNIAYLERYDSKIPDQEYDASHILVKTKAEADAIENLLADGADFATLARQKSTGPSGASGGELGWFGTGKMVKPFEDAVLKLAVGEISPPTKTQFGWHVIRLNNMRNLKIPTLDEVRDNLTKNLQQRAIATEITRLTEKANVIRPEVDIDPALIRDVSLLK